jgi:hypothetical protein
VELQDQQHGEGLEEPSAPPSPPPQPFRRIGQHWGGGGCITVQTKREGEDGRVKRWGRGRYSCTVEGEYVRGGGGGKTTPVFEVVGKTGKHQLLHLRTSNYKPKFERTPLAKERKLCNTTCVLTNTVHL